MYVTTFYSFKGGVGRSMALANAAVELAKRGRRVLAVDFDLEAPGLDTFDVLRPSDDVPGVIDFVHEYLDCNRAPDARRFLARSPEIGERNGELWIMPSGAQQATYSASFNQIDWAELYDKRDGYLLFEDLKAQWGQIVNPDYVLIDSRTGHTDTGGICTRQLPDAVAILFFPNEQNLRGLTKVVNDIRPEKHELRHKTIELHFIMSNVPDLDDEDRILEDKMEAFRKQLDLTHDPLIIHRYDSLSLLNQAVFTRERPQSRLAKEYRAAVDEIVGRNLKDRDGALEYLKRTAKRWRHRKVAHEPPSELDEKLRRIVETHSEDGEVLFELARFREDDPRVEPMASLFDRAIESGYNQPNVYLQRARVRYRNNDPAGADEDALHVLQMDSVPLPLVWDAVSLIRPDGTTNIAASPAVASLTASERLSLAEGLQNDKKIEMSIRILEQIEGGGAGVSSKARYVAQCRLPTLYIAAGKFGAAVEVLRHVAYPGNPHYERSIDDMDVHDAFDYGMAVWGATGEIHPKLFVNVVDLAQSELDDLAQSKLDSPSYLQRMAVAYWATGETVTAAAFRKRAHMALLSYDSAFSFWRYCVVPANEFKEDLDEIQAMIDGDTSRVPRFMQHNTMTGTCD